MALNVATHRRYVRASDRRLAEIAAKAAARINIKSLYYRRLESSRILTEKCPDGTVVTATNVIECSLAEIRRLVATPTSERYAWVMRELIGQDFIYGAIVHNAEEIPQQHVTVRTATFLKRHLLARNEQWCYVNAVQEVDKTLDHHETQGFTVVHASLHPDDVFTGKAQAASVIHIQGLSAVYLITAEPNRNIKGGRTKRAVRVKFCGHVASISGSGRPLPLRWLLSVRNREEPNEASNGAVLSRVVQWARSLKQIQIAVRRQRLDAQVLADLRKVQPSNSRCACCTRRVSTTKNMFGTSKGKMKSSRDSKRCQLCGFLVCARCVCSIGSNSSVSTEMSESTSRGIKYSQVVHLCEHCMQRVDDADYDSYCASKGCMSPLSVQPDSPSTEPASAAIARALSQVLSEASQEERPIVIRVIKHLLSPSEGGSIPSKFRADSAELAKSLGHLAHQQGFAEEISTLTTKQVSEIPIENSSSPEHDVPPLAGASGRHYALQYTDMGDNDGTVEEETEDVEGNQGTGDDKEAARIVDIAHPPIPADEAHRLQWINCHPDLISYMTNVPELELLCNIAREELQCATALVTIIGAQKSYVLAATKPALRGAELPRDHSMCAHTIMNEAPLLVRYPEADVRFNAMDLVRCIGVRFYFGFPIKVTYPEGGNSINVGTFCCAHEGETRDVSESQYALMATLAEAATRVLERRTSCLLESKLEP